MAAQRRAHGQRPAHAGGGGRSRWRIGGGRGGAEARAGPFHVRAGDPRTRRRRAGPRSACAGLRRHRACSAAAAVALAARRCRLRDASGAGGRAGAVVASTAAGGSAVCTGGRSGVRSRRASFAGISCLGHARQAAAGADAPRGRRAGDFASLAVRAQTRSGAAAGPAAHPPRAAAGSRLHRVRSRWLSGRRRAHDRGRAPRLVRHGAQRQAHRSESHRGPGGHQRHQDARYDAPRGPITRTKHLRRAPATRRRMARPGLRARPLHPRLPGWKRLGARSPPSSASRSLCRRRRRRSPRPSHRRIHRLRSRRGRPSLSPRCP